MKGKIRKLQNSQQPKKKRGNMNYIKHGTVIKREYIEVLLLCSVIIWALAW